MKRAGLTRSSVPPLGLDAQRQLRWLVLLFSYMCMHIVPSARPTSARHVYEVYYIYAMQTQ